MRRPSRVLSQTPSASTTSIGYCANTGARCVVMSGPPRRGCRQARSLLEPLQSVHPLYGATGCTLVEIVDCTHYGDRPRARGRAQVCVVTRDDVLDAGRL